MDAAGAIRLAREAAGLSKRELAHRAGTSPAAIVAYESGARQPTLPTLGRILAGANARVEVRATPVHGLPDAETLARRLGQVLDLAEHLPRRAAARRLPYPPLAPRHSR